MKKKKKKKPRKLGEKVLKVLKEVDAREYIADHIPVKAKELPHPIKVKLGKETEKRFFDAWVDKKNYPTWLATVQHSNPKQDRAEGTDAYLVDRYGDKIPVQIKRSRADLDKYRQKYPNFAGIWVIVRPQDDLETVRNQTLAALERRRLPAWLYKT